MQEHDVITTKSFGGRFPGALFVQLRLETTGAPPRMLDEDTAQAACSALASSARMQRCRVLAIACEGRALQAVIQFPASLPLRHLALSARQDSAAAAARVLTLAGGCRVIADDVWTECVQMNTLNPGDLHAAIHSIHLQAPPEPYAAESAGEDRQAASFSF